EQVHADPAEDRLHSAEQVFQRCRRMLAECQEAVVLDIFPKPLEEPRDALEEMVRRGVRVLIKAYVPAELPGANVVVHPKGRASLKRWPGQWLNFVTDGQEHLLAFLTSDARGLYQAVWSGSAYLSWVYHSAVGAEVILAAVQRGLEEGAMAADLRQTLSGYQYLFKSDLPGARALLERFGPSPRKGTPGTQQSCWHPVGFWLAHAPPGSAWPAESPRRRRRGHSRLPLPRARASPPRLSASSPTRWRSM